MSEGTRNLGPITEYLVQGRQDGTNGGWSHERSLEKAREGAAWMLADGCDSAEIYPIYGDRARDAHTVGTLLEVVR